MNKYTIKSLKGREELEVKRSGADVLTFKIGNKDVTVYTEDLAALVREELPKDRAKHLFSEIEDREILRGKARLVIRAEKDIKKGDYIRTSIDVSRYLDNDRNPYALRTTQSGFIF